jgi:outer membrane protein OmpA-like peptidoglycan-associated protein
MNRSTLRHGRLSLLVPIALMSTIACGGDRLPPKSLVDARAEYARAKSSPTIELDPTGVHEADLALQKAERAWEDSPDEPTTADLAVIAQRKAQIAQADAAAMRSDQEGAAAKQEADTLVSSQLKAARGELSQTKQTLDKTQTELQQQQAQRAELEAKLKDARDTIAKIAAVKDDDRGMVITLSGEVLFKTGKWDLKPAAMAKLDQIAEALQGKEQPIIVFGYTDNVGSRDNNMSLSQQRATSVRDYLVTKGIPSDLIKAQGKGPDEPVSDNGSVEGRAANRRVEIVVKPKGT